MKIMTNIKSKNMDTLRFNWRALVLGLTLLMSGQSLALESITFYHNDVLGSPVAVTDINGDLCWVENYKPYGDKLFNKDTRKKNDPLCGLADNERGYTGHVNDKDIGLTYMQARYYDPVVGRFMGIDPIGVRLGQQASFNRFAYAGNNPYKYTDPDGKWFLPLLRRLAMKPPRKLPRTNKSSENVDHPVAGTPPFPIVTDDLRDPMLNEESKEELGADNEDDSSRSDAKEKAKDRRKRQQEEAREEKFGEAGEPASEDYAKWQAKEKEKRDGKQSRRDSHDKKDRGDPDRTKEQIDEDYQ